MSRVRVRRRVEDEAAEEEPWTLESFDWDPRTCVARKKRIVASGSSEAAAATDVAFDQFEAGAAGDLFLQQPATNPSLSSLPLLETVDRSDAEPAANCEVIGCGASLEGLKRYYVRMRVCEKHLHAPAIVVNGVVSRFCQQCAKFQFVGEFSGGKKSCSATLERHNARHRAKVLARMQEQQDGDSDSKSTPAVGRGRAKAKGPKRKNSQPDLDDIGGRSHAASAAATAAAAVPAAYNVSSHTSGDDARVSAGGGSNCRSNPSGGAPVTDTVAHAYTRPYSPVGPVSADATAPAKPASPHIPTYGWDGASSAYACLPPRPLVTTGGNGTAVVSTGDRPVSVAVSGGGSAGVQHEQQQLPMLPHLSQQSRPQQQGLQPWAPVGSAGWQQQPQHDVRGVARLPVPPMPYDVHSALGALQGHLLMSSPTAAAMAPGPGLGAGGMHGSNYGMMPGMSHARYEAAGGPTPHIQHDGLSRGSTPGASNALGSDTHGNASQATATQSLMAGGGVGGVPAGSAGATCSGASQSAAEPSASSGGGGGVRAASPAYSPSEGVSATRGSGSGFMGGGSGDDGVRRGGDGSAANGAPQVGDMAARISSIMEELCPLIEQFKQEVAHGSAPPQESAFAAAAVHRVGSGTQAAVPVWGAQDRVGSNSLPPMVGAAMAMMQQASQLASSLQPPAAGGPWTVTSGALAQTYELAPQAVAPPVPAQPPAEAQVHVHVHRQHPQQPQQPMNQGASAQGWRQLSSYPGVAINEAAAYQLSQPGFRAASGPVGTAGGLPPLPPPPPQPVMMHPTAMPMTNGGGYSYHVNNPAMVGLPQQASQPSSQTANFVMASSVPGAGANPGPAYGQHPQPAATATAFAGYAPGAAAPAGDDDGDEEVFRQLMSFLEDPGEPTVYEQQQQQQQQLYQGIATAAQHAVATHQQAVHTMQYAVHVSPFYWPAHNAGQGPYGHAAHQSYGAGQQLHPYPHAPHGGAMAPPMAAMAAGQEADDVDPRELARVSLKAMNVLPHELPGNLRSNLRRWLKESRAEALQATLRPGCLQLVVDVLLPAAAAAGAAPLSSLLIPAHDADQAAADVFRILGQRLRDTYVQVDRQVLQMRVGERPVVLSWEEAAEEGGLDGAKYPTLKGCSAAAVCAGSEAVLQLHGGHLAYARTKAYARMRGHDLRATLLPAQTADGDGGSLRMSVAVPPGSVGLMVVEVGVGHLLGDWWPVLVLPRGHEGAAAEVRRLQAQEEEAGAVAAAAAAGPGRATRGVMRLVSELAAVMEVLSDTAAADAAAAAAATSAGAGATGACPGAGPSIAASGADAGSSSPPNGEVRSPSPSGGSTHAFRSDASAAGWSYAGTDTLSSTRVGSTMASYMTTASEMASTLLPAAGGAAPRVAAQAQGESARDQPAAAVTAGQPAAAAAAVDSKPSVPLVAPPPKPPVAAVRQALCRTARLLRYAVARGLPHLTGLLLTAAINLAPSADLKPAPQQDLQPGGSHAVLDRSALLAAAGVDLQALLPSAVLSGSAATVDRLSAFAAAVLHAPLRLDLPQGPAGMSVLHLAALLPDGGAMASHLVATQPWAAWEWLSLGWVLPGLCQDQGLDGPAAEMGALTLADANTCTATIVAEGGEAQGGDCAEGEESEEEDEEEDEAVRVLPPSPLKVTPGSLSVLLGCTAPLRRAVSVLEVPACVPVGASGGSMGDPATAALVSLVESWGRTGCLLLSALCEKLAKQRL